MDGLRVVVISLARRGGMVHFLAEVSKAIAALTPTMVVANASANQQYFKPRVDRFPFPAGRTALGWVEFLDPAGWYALYCRLAAFDPDVVHIAGVHEAHPLVAILCRLMRKPIVYTIHDPEPHPGAPWSIRIADILTGWLANGVVVLNKAGKRQLIARGFAKERISVIPHPLYTIFGKPASGSRTVRRTFLQFGRLESYKGVENLVRAFLASRDAIPGWALVIAGSGRLPTWIRSNPPMHIRVINRYLSDKEAAGLVKSAGVVVFPYSSSSESGVLALAYTFGRPVIATNVGGFVGLVKPEKTGLLVPPGDADALSRAMIRLGTDRLLRKSMEDCIRAENGVLPNARSLAVAHLQAYRRALRPKVQIGRRGSR